MFELRTGDCRTLLAEMPADSVDSIVTDPPYELGFMGKGWDSTGITNSVEMWAEALRVLKPGGHLLAFSGSRTYHRMVCAIEDAGFEIRDQIMWVYGSGFPKSLDVSKAIDRVGGQPWGEFAERDVIAIVRRKNAPRGIVGAGRQSIDVDREITAPATDAARQWQGWGTALKPAHEPICVARKPLIGTVAANVLAHGTGALNIDGCRVAVSADDDIHAKNPNTMGGFGHAGASVYGDSAGAPAYDPKAGRWPANLIHDGSDEVLAGFPQIKSAPTGGTESDRRQGASTDIHGTRSLVGYSDSGSAARFFYCAKASKRDRGEGNTHPTVGTPGWGGPGKRLSAVPGQVGEAAERMPPSQLGRWPANLIHDGSEEVLAGFPQARSSGNYTRGEMEHSHGPATFDIIRPPGPAGYADTGSAARFFYCAKTSKKDRGDGNNHPTVKPTDLMRYLCRLVTPPRGIVLDPFAGSGSTGKAAVLEGFRFIGLELDPAHVAIAEARILAAACQGFA